jgi:hypothetical protein
MTKTLVERLRERSPQIDLNEGDGGLMGEAADRIEKLEAALRPFADMDYFLSRDPTRSDHVRTARAALNGE